MILIDFNTRRIFGYNKGHETLSRSCIEEFPSLNNYFFATDNVVTDVSASESISYDLNTGATNSNANYYKTFREGFSETNSSSFTSETHEVTDVNYGLISKTRRGKLNATRYFKANFSNSGTTNLETRTVLTTSSLIAPRI